ncbi:DUF4145 domain-containing protein [Sulfitobacter dubius]|uniref:DUF4145 domain-containing protein n=1 Tax=Sulfitobacter dubius TaxID=218673 RepID=UPI0008EA149A|nr:DUF4145 domain-containing protein [Sulfitobacter dubius]SFH21122.1 protein of unknown function [Sulfitobacter dubius]
MKFVPPSATETAFNCPHCGALAKQFWFAAHAEPMEKDSHPLIISEERLKELKLDHIEDKDQRAHLKAWAERAAKGVPFWEHNRTNVDKALTNLSFSQCYNCDDISIWIYDRLVYPQRGEAPPANPDLPEDVRRDYDEASVILDLSPRGAAALIRLGIQKLCKELGQPGENINADIKALVAGGLDPRVQKALDAVRVIGNNAVHPGQIDLRDDRATAESLFRLMNLIADKMISEPKHVDEVYAALPEGARAAIEKRDSGD